MPGFPVHHQLPEFTQTNVHPSNHLILCHPLLLPSILPSIRVFSNESVLCIRWSKYWSFSFNISPSSEHPGLISFRMAWLDLLAVQRSLKSLLQHLLPYTSTNGLRQKGDTASCPLALSLSRCLRLRRWPVSWACGQAPRALGRPGGKRVIAGPPQERWVPVTPGADSRPVPW